MFRNYLKTAWRSITKNRFYSIVNVVGLSTGISFSLLIAAYVWSELQVNTHLKNANRQYIIQSKWKDLNQGYQFTTLGQLAKALKDNYPNLVANYQRWDGISSNVSKGTESFRENIAICDSTLLSMYGFRLLHGNAATALHEPYTVVITKDKAIKYFGKTDVVGQSLSIGSFSGSAHDFMITGVLNDLPKNSVTGLFDNYTNEFFVAASNLKYFGRNMDWQNPHIVGYIELQNGVKSEDLEKPMMQLIRQNASRQIAANLTPYVVPLPDYYLLNNNALVKKMLYALSAIAFFILLMAVINFINLSVSNSASRMREIGIRKVLGGVKRQLIFQFLIESIIIVSIATVLAFIIYGETKNLFSNILGKPIPPVNSFPVYFVAFPVFFIVLIGLIAGIYPAFVLSSLKSVDSLKGKLSSIKDKVWLRKSLIAFQFVTATIAFVGATIISQQVNLFLHSNLGYNKDYILSAQLPRDWTRQGVDRMETIRDEFSKMRNVKDVSLSFEVPDGNNSNEVPLFKFGSDSTQAVAASILENDENFLSVYQIPLVAGTPF